MTKQKGNKRGKVSQVTKVTLAGSLALTGVVGANAVESLNVGEGAINTVQAAEIDISELVGIESASVTISKKDGSTDPYTFSNGDMVINVNIEIDPDNVNLGTINPISVGMRYGVDGDASRQFTNGYALPPRQDIVMEGIVVGQITNTGFVFNENIRQINNPTISYTKELTIGPSIFSDSVGVKEVPVEIQLSNRGGMLNYAVLSVENVEINFDASRVKPSDETLTTRANKGLEVEKNTSGSAYVNPESSELEISKYINLGSAVYSDIEGPVQFKVTLPEHVRFDGYHTVPTRIGEKGKLFSPGSIDVYNQTITGADGLFLRSSLQGVNSSTITKTGENTYVIEVNNGTNWEEGIKENLSMSGRLPLIVDPQGYTMTKVNDRTFDFTHGEIKVEILNPGYEEEVVHTTQRKTLTPTQVGSLDWAFSADGTRNTPPVIVAEDLQLAQGVPFTENDVLNGVTADDDYDGDLTDKIVVLSNNVDTSQRGTYTIVYQVEDSRGFKVQHERTVRVMGTTAPVLVAYDQYVLQGSEFDPLKNVDALDYQDGELVQLSNEITVSGSVDTTTPGVYPLTYSVTDDDGETTTRTINVTVGADYEALLAEIEQKIDELEGTDEELLRQIEELRDSVREDIDNITTILDEQEALINQNITDIEQLEQNQTEIQNNITTINETITTVLEDIGNLKDSIAELEQKDIEQDARLDELEKSVTDLEGEIGKLKEEDTIINNYLTEITEIINNLPEGYDDTELRDRVSQLEKDKEDLQKQITDGNKALEDLTEVVNNIKEYDDTEIQNRLDVVNEIVVNLGDRVTNNETLIKEIMEILNNLKEYDDTELRDLIASLEQEQTVMNEYITNLETTINNLTTIINNLPDEYDDSALQDRINQLEEELAKVTADRDADKKALEDLTEVVNNIEEYDDTEIQKRVDAVTDRTTNVEERVTETERVIQEILEIINNLPEYEEYDDTELRESIKALEELLKQYQDINSTNETKIKELEQLIKDLVDSDQDANLQEQIDELNKQHQDMLDKLAELEAERGEEDPEEGGVTDDKLQGLLDKITQLEEAIKQLEESLSNTEVIVDVDVDVDVNTGDSGNGNDDNEDGEAVEIPSDNEPTDNGNGNEEVGGASGNGVTDLVVSGELVELDDPMVEVGAEDNGTEVDEVDEGTTTNFTATGTVSDSGSKGGGFLSKLPDTGVASAGTGLLATALVGLGAALGLRRKKGKVDEVEEVINEEDNEDK